MALKNTESQWGSLAKALHWLVAFCILAALFTATWIWTLNEEDPNAPAQWVVLIALHKSFGLTALGLALVRIGWMLANIRPKLPESMAKWQVRASHTTHYVLYGMMLAVPVLGYTISSAFGSKTTYFWTFTVPNLVPKSEDIVSFWYPIHTNGGFIMGGIVLIHIAAALYHHFKVKDDVLRGMLPGSGSKSEPQQAPAE